MSAGADSVRLGGAFVELLLKDDKFQQQLSGIGSKLSAWGAGLLSVGAIEETVRRSIKAYTDLGGEMVKMQERTGIAAGTLMELSHAADLSESSIGDVTMGIRFLQRNLVEAQQGSKAAQEKFERLGVSWQSLAGKGGAEQLLAISDAFAKMPDAATRTATAMDLFGRSGQSLVPFLKGGSASIRALMKDAREMGYTFSEESAKRADDLGDTLTRLQHAMTGLQLSFADSFAQPLTEAIGYTIDKLRELINMTQVALDYWGNFNNMPDFLKVALQFWAGTDNARGRAAFELKKKGGGAVGAGASGGGGGAPLELVAGMTQEQRDAAQVRADFKTSEMNLKSLWESGSYGMERYYRELFENQKRAIDFEIEQANKQKDSAADQKERAAAEARVIELTAQAQQLSLQQGAEIKSAREKAAEDEKRSAEEKKRAAEEEKKGRLDAAMTIMDADAEVARARVDLMLKSGQIDQKEGDRIRFEIERRILLRKKENAEAMGDEIGAADAARQLAALAFREQESMLPGALGAPKGAAIGTFSGQLAGMQGFGVGDVFDRQLEELQGMGTTLDKIQKNTAEGLT